LLSKNEARRIAANIAKLPELMRFGTETKGPQRMRPFRLRALLRTDFCDGIVAPLALLAQQWAAISCATAGACRSGLLAHGAARNHVLVHMPFRLGQSNRHANCEQRYSESFQHGFFLPRLCGETLRE